MAEKRAAEKLSKIAILVAFACVLQIAESFVPHPIPGLRLGLANMMTLTAMILLGFGAAMEVALLRTVLSAFVMGTFMSPTFLLSFSGALVSTAVMGFFYWLSGTHRYFRLSVIGISIIGAFTHNLIQLSLAYLLLVKHAGIFLFFPWLSIGSIATGWVVGVVTGGVCRRLLSERGGDIGESPAVAESLSLGRHYHPGDSMFHRAPASMKLSFVFFLAVFFFIVENMVAYLALFVVMILFAAGLQIPLAAIFSHMKRYAMLLATAFLLPFLFHSGGDIVADLGMFKITTAGIHQGAIFSLRILLLLFASCLLMKTTSRREMTRGLSQVLYPLGAIGVSRHRVASVLTCAWDELPAAWGATRRAIANADFKKVRTLQNLIPRLSDLIATLYIRAGKEADPEEKNRSRKNQDSRTAA